MDVSTGTSSGGPSRNPGGGEFNYSDPLRGFLNPLPRVLFSPRTFFRGISQRRGVANPLIFAAICTLIGAVLSGVFNELAQAVPSMQLLATESGLLSTATFAVIFIMAWLLINTDVYHLLARLLVVADNARLKGTFQGGVLRPRRRAGAGLAAFLKHLGRPIRPVPLCVRVLRKSTLGPIAGLQPSPHYRTFCSCPSHSCSGFSRHFFSLQASSL
jgi:Yip1-like protein